jgi:hypothetical protein
MDLQVLKAREGPFENPEQVGKCRFRAAELEGMKSMTLES